MDGEREGKTSLQRVNQNMTCFILLSAYVYTYFANRSISLFFFLFVGVCAGVTQQKFVSTEGLREYHKNERVSNDDISEKKETK